MCRGFFWWVVSWTGIIVSRFPSFPVRDLFRSSFLLHVFFSCLLLVFFSSQVCFLPRLLFRPWGMKDIDTHNEMDCVFFNRKERKEKKEEEGLDFSLSSFRSHSLLLLLDVFLSKPSSLSSFFASQRSWDQSLRKKKEEEAVTEIYYEIERNMAKKRSSMNVWDMKNDHNVCYFFPFVRFCLILTGIIPLPVDPLHGCRMPSFLVFESSSPVYCGHTFSSLWWAFFLIFSLWSSFE